MQNGETSEELAAEEADLDVPFVSITIPMPLSVPASTYPLWVQQALQEFTGKNLVGNLTLYYVPNWMEQSELSGTRR